MKATASTATPPAAALAAQVRDVSFAYPLPDNRHHRALRSLTLGVPSRSVFGLLGPNGSGKSTLLSILAGLRQPSNGEARALGEPPSNALRARIGLLFQDSSLDPLMTPGETLWLHGRLYGLGGHELRQRIESMLASVGLTDRVDSPVSTLSGGLKRRLELARVLLTDPKLILLDEPTTGLDPDAEAAIWARLREANGNGATIVLATNKVHEADRHCGRVAFIHGGELAAEGSPAELKAALKRDAVWVEWPDFPPALEDDLAGWDGVGRLTWSHPTLHATVDAASAFVPRLFQVAGEGIRGVRIRESTLEDAYFDIVGASLLEEGGEP